MRAIVPLALALLLAGCGGGPRTTETRPVAPFERIVVTDGVDVAVVPGDEGAVRVRAGRDVLDRVTTESSGGVLELGVGERGIVIGPDPLGDVRFEVPASGLAGLTVEGAGDVTVRGLDADRLDLEVSGAADVEASGTVDRLTATIRGAADADLSQLTARSADLLVQGAGDADLRVTGDLDVTVEGAGDVTYSGDPEVTSDVHGAGDVRRTGP